MFGLTEMHLRVWASFPRNFSEFFEGCVLDISRFPLQTTWPTMATPLISFPSNTAWFLIIKRFLTYFENYMYVRRGREKILLKNFSGKYL